MTIHTPSVAEPLGTRLRALLEGKVVADSRHVILFRESPMKMSYFFPESDVDMGIIDTNSATESKRKNGTHVEWNIRTQDRTVQRGAFAYTAPAEGAPDLRGYVAFGFEKMDEWYEEDEELIGHPRDPYTRIDVRKSSRAIRVEADGRLLAETRHPFILTETGLPIRYYIPKEDVKWDALVATQTETICPYKGRARYWSVAGAGDGFADIAWAYPEPLQDARPVRDTVCFYQEKLTFIVDGEPEEKPARHFSK